MEGFLLNNPDLKNLLKTYEQKRLKAQQECESRVNDLYENNPKLSNTVNKINKLSINLSKSILLNDTNQIPLLEKEIETLKEKRKIF